MAEDTCTIEGCMNPVRIKKRGWCSAHYQRWMKTGDPLKIRPARWDGYERPTCSVDGCNGLAHAHGMCSSHFCRNRRHGDPLAGRRNNATGTKEERFWSFVDRAGPDDCWHWNGGLYKTGYAQFNTEYAHRVAHELFIGPIPAGLVVDHTCHNVDPDCPGDRCDHRRCVNPAHLEAVTNGENIRRGKRRKRAA